MLSKKHVFLIGFMGSGKTTIGRMLSTATNLPFIDLDQTIESKQGKTVSAIFNAVGEAAFREMERRALLDCEKETAGIISTGGGIPCYFDNMDVMKQMGITIYLKASPHELAIRLSNTAVSRPLLKGVDYQHLPAHIEAMLSKREPFYLMADQVLETDGLSDEAVLQRCLELIQVAREQ